jgi:hypothetical protein
MRSLMLVVTLLAAGCGGSMYSQQIADYRSTATSLDATVDAHAKSAPAAAPPTCAAAMADYARQAGALVDRMQSMSSGMDQCMNSLGRADRADFAAGCAAIRNELDAHVNSGCSAPDLAAEMARHAAVMKGHTGLEMDRMGQMQSMENGVGAPMMSGLQGCH